MLNDRAIAEFLPPLFSVLAGTPRRRTVQTSTAAARSELAQRLHGLSTEEQHRLLTELVCAQASIALGYTDATGIDARQAFKDLGFDSLTAVRSEEHTSELQSLMRISYAVFCLKKTK